MINEYNLFLLDLQKQDFGWGPYQDLHLIRQFQQVPLKLPRGSVPTADGDFDTGPTSCFGVDHHGEVTLSWELQRNLDSEGMDGETLMNGHCPSLCVGTARKMYVGDSY